MLTAFMKIIKNRATIRIAFKILSIKKNKTLLQNSPIIRIIFK